MGNVQPGRHIKGGVSVKGLGCDLNDAKTGWWGWLRCDRDSREGHSAILTYRDNVSALTSLLLLASID